MERLFLAMLGLVLFSQTTFARDPLSPQEVEQVVQEFQFPGVYNEIKSQKDGGMFSSCWVYHRQFETDYPGAQEPYKVDMQMYIPNRDRLGSDVIPAVVMVPPVGGVNLLDRKTADSLCEGKMAAIILTNDFANIESQASGKLKDPTDHQETFYRIAAAIKGSMVMVEQDPNLDIERFGVFGVSLGGILTSFVMATQPDIAAGYFVVAGGDVPEILASSDQEEVSKIRRKRMQEEGFETRDEYEAYLRQYITLDPVDLAATMTPETLNMVIAEKDHTVPTDNQYLLHKAFGEPDAEYYNDSHVSTVISTLFPSSGRRRIVRFFKERFEIQNPRPTLFDFLDPYLPLAAN